MERGITRILHCTAAPAEFVATMRALLGVGPALQLTAVGPDGELVLDASAAQSQLLRRLLSAAASVEVCGRFMTATISMVDSTARNLIPMLSLMHHSRVKPTGLSPDLGPHVDSSKGLRFVAGCAVVLTNYNSGDVISVTVQVDEVGRYQRNVAVADCSW